MVVRYISFFTAATADPTPWLQLCAWCCQCADTFPGLLFTVVVATIVQTSEHVQDDVQYDAL